MTPAENSAVARGEAAPEEPWRRQKAIVKCRQSRRFSPECDRQWAVGHAQFPSNQHEAAPAPLWALLVVTGETWLRGGNPRGRMPQPGTKLLSYDPETDIALALYLVHEIDFPAQIALARALAGIGIVGPAPAIVGRVGHRLASIGERESGGAPRGGAAIQHADIPESAVPKFGRREPRQDAVRRGQHQHLSLRHPFEALRQPGAHREPRIGNVSLLIGDA